MIEHGELHDVLLRTHLGPRSAVGLALTLPPFRHLRGGTRG